MPGRLDELSLEQRERALSYLLEKLHAFQSSKQQRLLGLGRGMDSGLVLPPISSAKHDPWYGGQGGNDAFFTANSFSYPFMHGANEGGEKQFTSVSVQTNQVDIVAGPWSEWGKEPVNQKNVSGEVRDWGTRSSSMPLTHKNQTTFLKQSRPYGNITEK